MAKLDSGSQWFKFQAAGDKISGEYLRMGERDSPWGKKDVVYLKRGGKEVEVACTATLAKTLKENAKVLTPGAVVTIVLEELVPNKKGNPWKSFSVDVAGPGETGEVKGDADESIPF